MAPETQITVAPHKSSSERTAIFEFTSEPGVTFECRLSRKELFSPCTSPKEYPDLVEGTYYFEVRARDEAGNVAAVQTRYSWSIDLKAPVASIIAAPDELSRQTLAFFYFVSNEAQGAFECILDDRPIQACSPPQMYPLLGLGRHTFQVRARDEAGNTSPWVSHTWIIDTDKKPPAPPALQMPAPGETFFTASPTFSGTTEPGAKVTLFIDGSEVGSALPADDQGVWKAAPSFVLTWGEHRISATATDMAGNTSSLSSEIPFSTARRGAYDMGCAASSASGLAVWPWALLPLIGLLRRRSRQVPRDIEQESRSVVSGFTPGT